MTRNTLRDYCQHTLLTLYPQPLRFAVALLSLLWTATLSTHSFANTSPKTQTYQVQQISQVPDPKGAAYQTCLTHILCQPVTTTGSLIEQPVALVFIAFQDRILYPASKLRLGDKITVSTSPLYKASEETQSMMQVNDLPFSDAKILLVTHWQKQFDFVNQIANKPSKLIKAASNRSLIIQTLIAQQGKVTGGNFQDFYFWSHVPAMYQADFWKVPTTKKKALGPLKTISLFKQHLAAKGIDLIFVPIPRSTTIYPGLATNIEYDPEIDGRINYAVRDLMDQLEAEGVSCVDLTPTFLAQPYQTYDSNHYPIYRRNDTHWSPSGVRIAARLIAEKVKDLASFKKLTSTLKVELKESAMLEDFAFTMPTFGRPPSRRKPTETQVIYRIEGSTSAEKNLLSHNLPDAEIHLLGDSFSNAYGAGDGQAGLQPHLVKLLKTPVNKIASASGGSAISPNQFARNANHSKAKIVIWTVAESFLAAPDIWADIPLHRPDTLMLDKLLHRAHLSNNLTSYHPPTASTQGSFIAVGDPIAPSSTTHESRILWENVHLLKGKSPNFTVSTWIRKVKSSTAPPTTLTYPASWEIWVNRKLYKQQKSPNDREVYQRRKWKVSLKKFSGETIDLELVCRIKQPSHPLTGQACWIIPEVHGARLLDSESSVPSTTLATSKHQPDTITSRLQTPKSPAPKKYLYPLSIALILIFLAGFAIFMRQFRQPKK